MARCVACFEQVVDEYLATACGVSSIAEDAGAGGLFARSFEVSCRFQRDFEFAANMDVGLRLAELGKYSVHFELALFTADDDDVRCKPLATGSVVRVFIGRHHHKPVPIDGDLLNCLRQLKS